MKVTINWLRDYVDIDITPEELAVRMVKAGFEIEEIINLSNKIVNVVTGKILSVAKHPDADKLHVCQVDVGSRILEIVCGASNAFEGYIVPVALDGARLPDGKEIHTGKLRGVVSNGMLCSGAELGISEADFIGAGFDGLFVLDNNIPLGTDINKVLGNDDYVLDFNILANRPDCNSIMGIAKEVAAVLNKPLKPYSVSYKKVKENINKYVSVKVLSSDLCPRYMAKVVKNIKVERSTDIIRKRLRAVGLRPINNIVDVTNYVLIEVGQPMHAFDLRNINGSEIIIRRASNGETIQTLDGTSCKLNSNHLVIADKMKPIALAGIMGGINSCVLDNTTTIVFESARFARENIRRSSRELNLRSDSSGRFEKGVDYLSQQIALDRALTLLNMGDVVEETIDAFTGVMKENILKFKPLDINDILGITIDAKIMVDALNSLSIKSEFKNGVISSIIPINREDLVGVNDMAEEIIRLYGYSHIESDNLPPRGGRSYKQKIADRIKELLVGESMNEIITYSFTTAKFFDYLLLKADNPIRNAIKLKNALGEDFSIMRTTLAHSMISTIASNVAKGNKDGKLFEIARVYIPKALPLSELPDEYDKLCMGIFGNGMDFNAIKGIIENIYDVSNIAVSYVRANIEYLHPGISANIISNGKVIGYFGEIHPDVYSNYNLKTKAYIAELDVQYIKDNFIKVKPFMTIPRYPSIERDLAIVVDETLMVGDVIEYIKGFDSLIKNVKLFDIYRGNQVTENKKSIALSIEMRDNDKTLKIEETTPVFNRLIDSLDKKFKAKIRE